MNWKMAVAVAAAASFMSTGAVAKGTPAGPSPMILKAKRIIAERMIDPGSLQIRNTQIKSVAGGGQSVTILCGEYNSKNRFGGYTGFNHFIYEPAVMKGVLSVGGDFALDFFSESGTGDLSHDPVADVKAGADPDKLIAANSKYTAFAQKYLPACLGLS